MGFAKSILVSNLMNLKRKVYRIYIFLHGTWADQVLRDMYDQNNINIK